MSDRKCLPLQLLELRQVLEDGNEKMRVSRFWSFATVMALVSNVYVASAAAQSTEPTPTPTPLPEPPPVTNAGIWESFNAFLVALEDTVLGFWPSTPEALRLAVIVDKLHDSAPLAPWYLIGAAVYGAMWFLAAIALAKAWKLVKW
ncbi:hypothetical protein D3C72_737300 [compost metagenome]